MKYSRFTLKNVFYSAVMAVSTFAVVSCSSIPESVPDDDREIVQLAQDAADGGNYDLAKWYYGQLLEKYPDDSKIYVEASFEIAHLDIKKKKYEAAVPRLNEILYIYENVPVGYLPSQYKKLAENDLKKIPEETLSKINEKIESEKAKKIKQEGESQVKTPAVEDDDDEYDFPDFDE